LIEREDFLTVSLFHKKLNDVFLGDNFIVIIIDHSKCEFDDLLMCEQAEGTYRWYPLDEADSIDVFLFDELEEFVNVWRKHTRFFFFDKLKYVVLGDVTVSELVPKEEEEEKRDKEETNNILVF